MCIRDSTSTTIYSRCVLTSHHTGELWGLDVNPNSPDEYCTVGDDKTLRIWSISQRKQVRYIELNAVARCCAYSPDGSMIAVGFGKGKTKEDGMFRVYRDDSTANPPIVLMYETKEAKQWVSEIKFSPDGRTLAVGTHDNSIYFYGVPQQFKRKFKFSKHNSFITHFDFSSDSKYLQSNCGAYELLFSDATTGAQVSKLDTLKDSEWGK